MYIQYVIDVRVGTTRRQTPGYTISTHIQMTHDLLKIVQGLLLNIFHSYYFNQFRSVYINNFLHAKHVLIVNVSLSETAPFTVYISIQRKPDPCSGRLLYIYVRLDSITLSYHALNLYNTQQGNDMLQYIYSIYKFSDFVLRFVVRELRNTHYFHLTPSIYIT
jgi:hypothetical protein